MIHSREWKLVALLASGFVFLAFSVELAAQTSSSLHQRARAANSGIRDISARMVVLDADKKNVRNINPSLIEALNIKEMDVFYRSPDKFRAEAMAKGLQLTWILNGDRQLISVPGMMIRKMEDIGRNPGRKRNSLDLGFVSDQLWQDFNVTVISQSKDAHRLRLTPKVAEGKRHELIWVEPETMKLLRRDRHSRSGTMSVRYTYGNHRKFRNLAVAQQAKVYDPNGEFAGTIEYRNLKINSGLAESLFSLFLR